MSKEYTSAAEAALRGHLHGHRRRAWAVLAGVPDPKRGSTTPAWETRSVAYAEQLERDTNRALHRVQDEQQRVALRVRLTRILNALFAAHPTWHYFQGFHDLVGVLLLVAEEERAPDDTPQKLDAETYYLAEQLSCTYWSGHLLTGDLSEARATLSLLPTLLHRLDERLANFLRAAAPEPIFALPWLLTWFAYNLDGLAEAALAFDLLMCTHPLAALYLAAVMVHTQCDVILGLEQDYAAVHGALSRLPSHLAPQLSQLIPRAASLLCEHPPSSLFSLSTFPLASPVHQFPFPHHAPLVYPRLPFRRRVQRAISASHWGYIAFSSILVALIAWAALRHSPCMLFLPFYRSTS